MTLLQQSRFDFNAPPDDDPGVVAVLETELEPDPDLQQVFYDIKVLPHIDPYYDVMEERLLYVYDL